MLSPTRVHALRAKLAASGLPSRDVDLFELRLARHRDDLLAGLRAVYGNTPEFDPFVGRLLETLAEHHRRRPEALRILDLQRQLEPDWLLSPRQVGYVCYVDRFAGTLRGLGEHLDHLEALGVTYLHLMPLLEPRPGNSDGGYAVADFRRVDPRLGTLDELESLAGALRERGISLCIDLVLNHVAREHAWASAARDGDPRYQRYFHTFADRELPDRYEESLPEVFPTFAPGNFTHDHDLGRWVWTTFNAFQWDLRWKNPEVFLEFLDIILELAARGVEVFRLDAIAFIWKRLGTDCQNQPEVHAIVRALRAAVRVVAPAVGFKAEAIVGPQQLLAYLGQGEHHGKLSDLAYHNSLMVQLWSAFATRDTRLLRHALAELPDKPATTAWATYLRCHDDIGWAIDDRHAAAVGWRGPAHRAFLADYYTGSFKGSHARGVTFQDNPRTGDRRSCGSTASLLGLERALDSGDAEAIEASIQRVLLGHALIMSFPGIPLLYMGDEIGLLNDERFRDDPALADDNRWIHRPAMPWSAVARRHQPGSVEQRLFDGLVHLTDVRKRLPQLHASVPLELHDAHNDHLLALRRPHPEGPLWAIFNLSEHPQRCPLAALGISGTQLDELSDQRLSDDQLQNLALPPFARLWLRAA